MIIIPAMNRIVDQLIPVVASSPAPYQKERSKKAPRFSVSQTARNECMQTPNTIVKTNIPLQSVT